MNDLIFRSYQSFVLGVSLDLITKMPLFGKASKSPVELVRVLKESLVILEKGADGKKQGRSQFWNSDINDVLRHFKQSNLLDHKLDIPGYPISQLRKFEITYFTPHNSRH